MPGNCKIMGFSLSLQRQALMTAGLVSDTVAVPGKQDGEFFTIDIPGQFHTAISSSFTRWSRIR